MAGQVNTLIPLSSIEQSAQTQIYKILELPFLKYHAVMPDIHGSTNFMPVGMVAIFEGAISPYGVGYDIGCGMTGGITNIPYSEISKKAEKIYETILKSIPCGVGIENITPKTYEHKFTSASGDKRLSQHINAKIGHQYKTLGSGNHFIEIGFDKDGNISIIIHSGSRKPGYDIAGHYIALSKLNDKHLPGSFLDVNSDLGKAYHQDMNFMLQFALDNRLGMLNIIMDILGISKRDLTTFVNENHNHAQIVPQYGENMVLHRKGATPADKDQLGVIPGNMRDGTYITVGLGNEQFLCSASHGAGRKMARKKAKESIKLETFQEQMRGIICPVSNFTLDEAPDAYKKIDKVIGAQHGIVVDVINKTTPKIVVKGT